MGQGVRRISVAEANDRWLLKFVQTRRAAINHNAIESIRHQMIGMDA